MDGNRVVQEVVSNDGIQLQLWTPFGTRESIDETPVKSHLTLQGVMDCRAMCSMRDSLQTAAEYLKVRNTYPPHPSVSDGYSLHHQMDILQSLTFRMKTLEESYDEDLALDVGQLYELPRRVWGKWKVRFILLCAHVTSVNEVWCAFV